MSALSDESSTVRSLGAQPSAGRLEILRVLGRPATSDSVVDQILVAVGTAIVEGRLRPGDDLNSVELARMFRSSRTPVREALLTLEREGLVEIAAHRRPRVRGLLLGEVREIYELRATLHGLVSRRIVERATDSDIELLRDCQREMDRAATTGNVDRYFWLTVGLRNNEADIAGNAAVRRVLDSAGVRTLQLRHLGLAAPGRLRASAGDHARLLRAYEERDAGLASALSETIVRRGLRAVESAGWSGDRPPHDRP
jgi:DNA-binding GntR family transcriptional regulator